VKQLKAKELEKRLDVEENENKPKNFKSADAQKPKATLKTQKNLPPKPPLRSITGMEHKASGKGSQARHMKNVPSTTKASSQNETPKSLNSAHPINYPAKRKPTPNDSQISSENGKAIAENSRALMLYETPTVASQHKKQGAYKPEENLPPWGIQSVHSKHAIAKRTPSATTRTTVTPRANTLKRGKTSVTSTALVVKEDSVNKTHNHIQRDIKIRKNKRNRSRQSHKNNARKMNTSHSNTSKTRLNSKDRKASMKRLGIKNNLPKKKNPAPSVDEEKYRIQKFLDSFFQNEANSNKFTEGEKRKFAMNFKKAYIENQYGNVPAPQKPNPQKLKALPAPPVVKKKPLQEILPPVMKHEEDPKPAIKDEEPQERLGNVKMYSNAFKNNFNFMGKKDDDSIFGDDSSYKYTTDQNDHNDFSNPSKMMYDNLTSQESDEKPK